MAVKQNGMKRTKPLNAHSVKRQFHLLAVFFENILIRVDTVNIWLGFGIGGLKMAEPKKPFYRDKKWKLGRSFGWWHIPYCPHCKRQLGLMVEEQKAEKCPMCGKPLEWDGAENG